MAATVDFRFRGNSRDLENASQRARSSLRGVESQADRTSAHLSGVSASASSATSRLSGLARVVAGRALLGLGASAVVAGGAIGALGFNFLRTKEQAEIAFTTMLHDGGRARAFLGELQSFAAKTPFEFPELIQTTQRMMAMGFAAKDVIPSLTAIGDQVADLGGGAENLNRVTIALGQMQLKGRVQSEEMLQLIESGVNGWKYLASAMGTNVAHAQDLVTKRMVDGRFAVKAILAGMERDHANAMEKQSHTFQGLWSTIKDTVSAGAGSALEPLYVALERGMQRLVNFMGTKEWTAGVQRFSDYVSETVVPRIIDFGRAVFEFFRQNGRGIADALGTATRFGVGVVRMLADLSGHLGGVRGAAGFLIGGILAAKLLAVSRVIMTRVVPATMTLRTDLVGIRVASALAGTQMTVMGALGARAMYAIRGALISTGIGLLLIGLGLAAGYVVTHWDKAKAALAKIWEGIKVAFRVTWAAMKEIAKGAVYVILQTATLGIRGILEVASHLPFVGKKARAALDSINNYLDKWKPNFAKVAAAAGTDAGDALGRSLYNAFTPWAGTVGGALSALTGAGATGATGGNAGARGQAPGTAFALVTRARQLGPGSGGVYATGGGHSGIAKPGTMLDCSGYVFQVFTQSGFKGFPGISETQWSQASGPNWTSERIPVAAARPGDVVFMVGSPIYPSPGHVGIVVSGSGAGAVIAEYYSSGKPPRATRRLGQVGDLVGVKRFYLVKQERRGATTATPPAAPAIDVPDYEPLAGKGGAAKKPSVASAGALRTATETVGGLRDRLRVLAREGLGDLVAGVGERLDALSARIRKGMKADDLAALRRQLGGVKATIDRAFSIRDLRSSADGMLKGLADAFRVETPRTEAQVRDLVDRLRVQIAQVRKQLRGGIDADTLKVLRGRLSALKDQYSEALDEARRIAQEKISALNEVVSNRRSSLGDAFGRITDKALAVFDAQTDRLIRNLRVKIASIAGEVSLAAGDETPARRRLRELQEQRAASDLLRRRAEEDAGFAQRLAEATDPAEIAQIQADMAAAARDRELDDQETLLERAAQAEEKARDDAIQAETDRITQERALTRERFAARLAEVQKGWTDEKVASGAAMNELVSLLDEYGIDFAAAGGTLGAMFAQTFKDALDDVRVSINDLIKALNNLREATGGSQLPTVGGTTVARGATGAFRSGAIPDDVFYGNPTTTYVITGNTFLGATEREVGRSLERMVTPAQRSAVSYPVPI